MTPEDLIEKMGETLAAERDALRRLDVAAVVRAADAKERLLEQIKSAPSAERAGLVEALRQLRPALQQNLVLLAHARDYIRDATLLCGGGPGRRPRLRAEL